MASASSSLAKDGSLNSPTPPGYIVSLSYLHLRYLSKYVEDSLGKRTPVKYQKWSVFHLATYIYARNL